MPDIRSLLDLMRTPPADSLLREFANDAARRACEAAPPGKKAERFIHKNKTAFKQRYGKDWEGRLYATAWKLFG